MVSEACFRRAPMSHRVAVRLIGGLELRFIPIPLERGIPLQVEGFLIRFAKPRVEDEFRPTAGIAYSLRLRERHIVRYSVFRLAGGEALQEGRPAILDSVQDSSVKL